uniref:Uncharacterized protein n=1 Tax=Rhizophora mucronata TaxID=61149 RepID=A0A2P2JEG2_RHIMU
MYYGLQVNSLLGSICLILQGQGPLFCVILLGVIETASIVCSFCAIMEVLAA